MGFNTVLRIRHIHQGGDCVHGTPSAVVQVERDLHRIESNDSRETECVPNYVICAKYY
jgi:hypothetical protein